MRNLVLLLLVFTTFGSLSAQMERNGQTLYGNEWIDYSKDYLKIQVDEDGMYIVSFNNLVANGFNPQQINGSALKMFSNGEEVPLLVSSNINWGANDFLIFHGERNDGEIDAFHFEDAEGEQLNPEMSMYDESRSYFLTLVPGGNNLRYQPHSNDVDNVSIIKEELYQDRLMQVFSDDVWDPSAPTDRDLQFSSFINMDGFASRMLSDHQHQFVLTEYNNSGPDPELLIRIGSNNATHFVQLDFNNNPILNDNYQGSQVRQHDLTFSKANLRNGVNNIRLRGLSTADNVNIAFMQLKYPRNYNAFGEGTYTFYTNSDNQDEYVEIPNYSGTTRNFLFDVDNNNVVIPKMEGTLAKVIIPGGPVPNAEVILTNASQLLSPRSMEKTSFQNIDNLNPEYLILTSEILNQTENGTNIISEYEDFRSSQLGGNYKTASINVEDIYNQFGYGINKHSYAIKNFGAYVKTRWTDFEMVFIIGKGLSFANNYSNTIATNVVPTYGLPGSDNLLFEEGEKSYPYVGVGRLAAQSQRDVSIYLDKARINAGLSDVQNLSIDERIWLKQVLHLSGGDPRIQQQLFDTLTVMEGILENNQFAADVTTFRKNSSDPVTTALTDQILEKINSGISILTFFGHSSAGTFDFSVEDPAKYSNEGRHPVVLSMGCHSGDIHENIFSLSEDFLLTEELGSVAFIASSGNAYPEPLSAIGTSFYQDMGQNFYGQPIALALQQVSARLYAKVESLYNSTPSTITLDNAFANLITLLQQNTLHGDPAISFFSSDAADYVVDFSTLKTEGVIGTAEDNITVNFDIINLGAGLDVDSLNNYLVHSYGNESDTVFFKSVAVKNRENITVSFPNPKDAAIGKNSINIVLDHDNKVPESPAPQAETNNSMIEAWSVPEGFCFFIFDNSAKPIYPAEFSIVGQQGLTLLASAPNALKDTETYEIQVDTTELFNSPFFRAMEVVSRPSLIEWTPNIIYREEQVYYWRIKPKNSPNAIWSNSSFVYLDQVQNGWNQSHFYQWTKDATVTGSIDTLSRDFRYADNVADIRMKNGVFPSIRPEMGHQDNVNTFIEFGEEVQSGVYMATFDANTGVPRHNDFTVGGEFGSHIAAQWVGEGYFTFAYRTNTPAQRANLINFIEDVVPDGDYIAFMTIQRTDLGGPDYKPELWAADAAGGNKDIFSVLESYGAQQVRSLENDAVPYIFVFKKNDRSWTPIERIAVNRSQEINAEFKISARWHQGSIRSTAIGPAQKWDRLLWNLDEIDLQEDEFKFDLIGCTSSGAEVVLRENIDEFSYDLSDISAAQYPYLKLNLFSSDETSRTAPQMSHWRILYDGIPEAVLDTKEKFAFESDTIFGAENFKFSTIARNITNVDMDSLLVEYAITDRNNLTHVTRERVAPLKAFESVEIEFETGTSALIGANEFKVEINPREDQIEQFSFNNLGIRSFLVEGDVGNPVLDVTFDGVRILDKDVVSPNPTISVILKDDNDLNPITDISSFELGLKRLPDGQEVSIPLDDERITFFPADSSNNFCARVEYTPEFDSGEYIFFAQGRDVSGNLSGDQSYQVQFEVILESMVSNVLNYPNPFSTSTEFIFTLTGREVPDEFSIQIYSMSGKVVKEITRDELGPLRIGLNRTDYKWTGTDDFGNKLGNGVYFYRIITSEVGGETLDHFNNPDVDQYFKKGFGKLVIMR